MTQWRGTLLRGTAPLAEAIRIIDASSKQICLVVDDADRLLGTITDGDIRRAIAKGETFAPDNLGAIRPGSGVSALEYFDWLGRVASRDYAAGEMLAP